MEAKKSLGQNFLRDESVVARIGEAISAREGEVILEVGPGEGVLTEVLARSGARVVAVELDDRLISVLREKFREFPNVEIVHGNILRTDVLELLTTNDQQHTTRESRDLSLQAGASIPPSRDMPPSPRRTGEKEIVSSVKRQVSNALPYRVVGNLPYYITSAIVRMFLELKNPPREMFFMVQKEVADRICAKPGEMSILGVSVQYYAKPELLFVVPKEAFDPVPKVESAFVKIVNSKYQKENIEEERKFFRIVKIGFSARRKTLANNLANGFHRDRREIEVTLESLGYKKSVRAQELSVEEWERLASILQKR